MIKPNEIEKIVLEREIKTLNYRKDLEIEICEIAELYIDKMLITKLGIQKKYNFVIPVYDWFNCGGSFERRALTFDKETLTNGANILTEKLKDSGWKNVKVKVSNLWWPIMPKIKVWMEVGV